MFAMAGLERFSDIELLRSLTRDDHAAYNELFNRYFSLIYAHAFNKLQDEDQAKDVVQEVFATLWFNREKAVAIEDLAGYLFTATRNRIFDIYAHQQVRQKHVDSINEYVNHTFFIPTDHLIRERDLQAYIDKQIAELPTKMRLIFELSRKEQLSYKEIAERLSTTENNVSKQVNNALRILRTKLGGTF